MIHLTAPKKCREHFLNKVAPCYYPMRQCFVVKWVRKDNGFISLIFYVDGLDNNPDDLLPFIRNYPEAHGIENIKKPHHFRQAIYWCMTRKDDKPKLYYLDNAGYDTWSANNIGKQPFPF